MLVTGFFHAGITIADMDRSLRFYRDGLGLKIYFDKLLDAEYLFRELDLKFDNIRAVYLEIPGGGYIELLEYRGIERLSAACRPCDYGSGHLCLYVTEIADLVDRLVALGGSMRSHGIVDITSGPNEGAQSVYLRDPDGYSVELFVKPGANES